MVSTSADDVFMEVKSWKFLKGISHSILSGDIDAYLEMIEKMRPIDDLLEYGSDFEFGTDNSNTMEVEFRINVDNLISRIGSIEEETYNELYREYVYGSSIRVARDLFALLLVRYMILYAKDGENTIFKVKFDKSIMQEINFRDESSADIIKRFKCYGTV